jgi:hypothetical protein
VKLNKAGVSNKYIMRIESYQIFAQLLEGYVNEASTTMSLIAGQPGGKEVIQKLHKDMQLAHDIGYKQVDKISWSELKDSYRGAWVIIQGTKGTGAIRARNSSYEAVASTGGEVETFSNDRGGNILDFLKGKLGGNPKSMQIGKDTGAVSKLHKTRSELNKQPAANAVNSSTLLKKFRPLWIKGANAAIADIKGMVGIMIKNDSFEKAARKIEQLKALSSTVEQVESGGNENPDLFKNAVETAINMAAHYYYPDETGELTRGYRTSGFQAQNQAGPMKLLTDIRNGDTQKLGTILSFFKRSLIS